MTQWLNVSDVTPHRAYSATAGQTVFTVPFTFFADGDLKVYKNDVLLTLTTHYTVTGALNPNGGAITLVTPATLNDSIVIGRVIPLSLTTHVPPSGRLDVPALNLQMSRLVAMMQQVALRQTRSLRQPTADVADIGDLPSAIARASKYLGFDADGDPVALSSVTGAIAAQAFWVSLLSSASTQEEAQAGLGLTEYLTANDGRINVRSYGCVGDGSTNDTVNFQAAITAAAASGGIVDAPAGNYSVPGGLTLPGNVTIVGDGQNATYIQAWHTDVTVITMSGHKGGLEKLTVYGKGVNNDTGTLGATKNAVVVGGVGNIVRDVTIWGGLAALYITGTDGLFENVDAASAYGQAVVVSAGANWYVRNKFDHSTTGIAPTSSLPYSAWAATTAYTIGQVRTTGGYAIICSQAGFSGATAPTVRNYGLPITDGTAQWLLQSPASYSSMIIGSGGENHLVQTDFTGPWTNNAVQWNPTSGSPVEVLDISHCVLSDGLAATDGGWLCMVGNEMGGNISIAAGYTGGSAIIGNRALAAAANIAIGANVNNFVINGNDCKGGTISVAAGTSDHYTIQANIRSAVSDNGTGLAKAVGNNVT